MGDPGGPLLERGVDEPRDIVPVVARREAAADEVVDRPLDGPHVDAAGEPEHALVASVAAGREASNALAFAESFAHCERALELGEVVPDAEQSEEQD